MSQDTRGSRFSARSFLKSDAGTIFSHMGPNLTCRIIFIACIGPAPEK
jgi:hypothetical protein